jgi:hypothetical protein
LFRHDKCPDHRAAFELLLYKLPEVDPAYTGVLSVTNSSAVLG